MNFGMGVIAGVLIGVVLAFFVTLGLEPLLAYQVKTMYGPQALAERSHFIGPMILDYVLYIGIVLSLASNRDTSEFSLGLWLSAPIPAFAFTYFIQNWRII